MTKCNNTSCYHYDENSDNKCFYFHDIKVCEKYDIQVIEHLKELSNHCKSIKDCDDCSLYDYCSQIFDNQTFENIKFKEE